jgi:hypothetical protein
MTSLVQNPVGFVTDRSLEGQDRILFRDTATRHQLARITAHMARYRPHMVPDMRTQVWRLTKPGRRAAGSRLKYTKSTVARTKMTAHRTWAADH